LKTAIKSNLTTGIALLLVYLSSLICSVISVIITIFTNEHSNHTYPLPITDEYNQLKSDIAEDLAIFDYLLMF